MSELERTRSNNAGQTVMVPRETGLATTEFAKFQTLCRARLAYWIQSLDLDGVVKDSKEYNTMAADADESR